VTFLPFPPAMQAMCWDKVIRDHPHTIIVYMLLAAGPPIRKPEDRPAPVLNFTAFVQVRTFYVCGNTGLTKRTVLNSLDMLVRRGYLEEGPRGADNVRSFRLVWQVPVAA
jgi:hypothetical protein